MPTDQYMRNYRFSKSALLSHPEKDVKYFIRHELERVGFDLTEPITFTDDSDTNSLVCIQTTTLKSTKVPIYYQPDDTKWLAGSTDRVDAFKWTTVTQVVPSPPIDAATLAQMQQAVDDVHKHIAADLLRHLYTTGEWSQDPPPPNLTLTLIPDNPSKSTVTALAKADQTSTQLKAAKKLGLLTKENLE